MVHCDLEGQEVASASPSSGRFQDGAHLVVILPALNEEATIADVIRRIPRAIPGIGRLSVIVVDDGSTDRTAELARRDGARVISHKRTMGVGSAFNSGVEAALRQGADIIVNMDADGQFDPADIPALIRPIQEAGYGFVTCTRFARPEFMPEMPAIKRFGNKVMCRIINTTIPGPRFTDVSCGFRAFTRDTALRLTLFGRFTYTHETFVDLATKGISMTEVPLRVRGVREHGQSRVASNLWRYGVRSLEIILRTLRDARPLAFFGSLALLWLIAGAAMYTFVAVWWLLHGQTTPWTSLLTVGTLCSLVGLVLLAVALVSDQIGRLRRVQDQLLYFERRRSYGDHARLREDGTPRADE